MQDATQQIISADNWLAEYRVPATEGWPRDRVRHERVAAFALVEVQRNPLGIVGDGVEHRLDGFNGRRELHGAQPNFLRFVHVEDLKEEERNKPRPQAKDWPESALEWATPANSNGAPGAEGA